MDRDLLSDAQWARLAPLLPGKPGDPGRSGEDNRLFVEAVLWVVRTGVPWRDLPERFGTWGSVWRRFRRWGRVAVLLAVKPVDPGRDGGDHLWVVEAGLGAVRAGGPVRDLP